MHTTIFLSVVLISLVGAASLRLYFTRSTVPVTFDRTDAGVSTNGAFLVEFTSPYCYECKEALPLMKAASHVYGAPLAVIDAKDRPDLADKYEIRTTPTILVVDRSGRVTRGWLTSPPENELIEAIQLAGI